MLTRLMRIPLILFPALVQSLALIIGGVLGPFSGRLMDHVGSRTVLVSCFLTCAVLFLTSSFAPNLYVLFATYSVLFGYVVSSIYCSAVIPVVSHFDKKRSLALGLVSAGFGAGVFTMNPITQLLLDRYGLRGSYRVLAVVMTVSSLLGCVVNTRISSENRRTQARLDNKDKSRPETSSSRWKRVLKSVFVNAELTIFTLSLSIVDGMGTNILIVHLVSSTNITF